jgi:acyl-CoA thioester hydrolase
VLSGFPYVWPVEVRFRDLDALGHVNNAVFLTYLESARIAYWLELSGRSGLDGLDMILARVEIDYRAQAGYREQLDVGVRVAAVGRSSVTMELKVVARAPERLIAESRNVMVFFDYAANRSRPLTDELRRKLMAAGALAREA